MMDFVVSLHRSLSLHLCSNTSSVPVHAVPVSYPSGKKYAIGQFVAFSSLGFNVVAELTMLYAVIAVVKVWRQHSEDRSDSQTGQGCPASCICGFCGLYSRRD